MSHSRSSPNGTRSPRGSPYISAGSSSPRANASQPSVMWSNGDLDRVVGPQALGAHLERAGAGRCDGRGRPRSPAAGPPPRRRPSTRRPRGWGTARCGRSRRGCRRWWRSRSTTTRSTTARGRRRGDARRRRSRPGGGEAGAGAGHRGSMARPEWRYLARRAVPEPRVVGRGRRGAGRRRHAGRRARRGDAHRRAGGRRHARRHGALARRRRRREGDAHPRPGAPARRAVHARPTSSPPRSPGASCRPNGRSSRAGCGWAATCRC